MHIHFHSSHNTEQSHPHGGPFGRVSWELDAVLGWLTGPGMTDQQRSSRRRAEALNERYGSGLM